MPHKVDPDYIDPVQGGNRGIIDTDIPPSLNVAAARTSPQISQYPLNSSSRQPLIEMDDIIEPQGEYAGSSIIQARKMPLRCVNRHRNTSAEMPSLRPHPSKEEECFGQPLDLYDRSIGN